MYVHALSKQILIYDCLILVHTLIMRYHPAIISTFNSLISIKCKRLVYWYLSFIWQQFMIHFVNNMPCTFTILMASVTQQTLF